MNKKTDKALAMATVAIALSAVVQAIIAFRNFKPQGLPEIILFTGTLAVVILMVILAIGSWKYLRG
ncbi:MAG: hypothetical protein HY367_03420 [Candidatus Aenigmarchaeota archaeon]|nr:hypothetical protein [Candidatus Aenigmarchaeota archaeon]